MKRTTRAEKIEQIQRAAFMFARLTRDANEIAAALRVSSRTVQRMIHLPAFQAELDRLDYQGERRFRKSHRAQRSAERTQQPEYQKVKQLWHQMTDIPERRRARIIAADPTSNPATTPSAAGVETGGINDSSRITTKSAT